LWSLVLAAGQSGSTRSEEALATLCRTYWYPLYAFIRRRGSGPHDAEDLAQEFFLHLLEKGAFEKVRREKGRFRSFLLASLKNFLADSWEKSQALKRGGGAKVISFEAANAEETYRAEPSDYADPERLFDRRWAVMVLERVLSRLESEFVDTGRKNRFDQLRVFLTGDSPEVTYAAAAQRLGMTQGAVKVAVLRMRQRYRELLQAEVAETVATSEEIEAELRHLFAALSP
jgi:RNA polymerase sigma-70 factor (ECF subfamily)